MVEVLNLRDLAKLYLSERRKSGYVFQKFENNVASYLDHLSNIGAVHISIASVLSWRSSLPKTRNETFAGKYGNIRKLSVWANYIDDRNEVLPTGLFGSTHSRANIYFYPKDEIKRMIFKIGKQPSRFGLKNKTAATIIGILATTGMRISEVLALNDEDINLNKQTIYIKESKNSYERVLPFQKGTKETFQNFRELREDKSKVISRRTNSFFMSERGLRISESAARHNIYDAMSLIGLRKRFSARKYSKGPRIHDFRHTFAIRTMITWYDNGLDPNHEMLALTNYLGHTHIKYTNWYLENVPELMQRALERAESN